MSTLLSIHPSLYPPFSLSTLLTIHHSLFSIHLSLHRYPIFDFHANESCACTFIMFDERVDEPCDSPTNTFLRTQLQTTSTVVRNPGTGGNLEGNGVTGVNGVNGFNGVNGVNGYVSQAWVALSCPESKVFVDRLIHSMSHDAQTLIVRGTSESAGGDSVRLQNVQEGGGDATSPALWTQQNPERTNLTVSRATLEGLGKNTPYVINLLLL